MRAQRGSNPFSRAVHRVDHATSRPVTAVVVLLLVVAIQLKLDELVRALPGADDHLVQVESGEDAGLAELEQRHLDHHVAIRADE